MSAPQTIVHDQPVYVILTTKRGHLQVGGEERAVCNQGGTLLERIITSFDPEVKIAVKARDHHAYVRIFGYLSAYRTELVEIEKAKKQGTWPQ